MPEALRTDQEGPVRGRRAEGGGGDQAGGPQGGMSDSLTSLPTYAASGSGPPAPLVPLALLSASTSHINRLCTQAAPPVLERLGYHLDTPGYQVCTSTAQE